MNEGSEAPTDDLSQIHNLVSCRHVCLDGIKLLRVIFIKYFLAFFGVVDFCGVIYFK